jgi:hypothetical protein
VIYWPVLATYFSGDDFFHFKVSLTDGSLGGFVRLFGFYPYSERGIAFYRPLMREAIYNLFYSLFGLKALPFRLLQFGLHWGNITLVYVLAKRLLRSRKAAFFSALFFGIGAANVGILYYLAGGIQALGATFLGLLVVYAFSLKKYGWAWVFFMLALACHEMAVGVAVILMGWGWMEGKKFKWRDCELFWPYFVILGGYLYLNIFVIGFSGNEVQYRMVFSILKLLNTLGWYAAWSLGLPEMTVDFVGSGLRFDPRLAAMWGRYFVVIWPTFLGGGLMIIWLAVRNWGEVASKRFLFLVGWFGVGILPVIFLPVHKKTYYLALSLPGFWMAIGSLVERVKLKVWLVLVGVLVLLNVTSVKLAEKTYWALNRARVATKVLSDFEREHEGLPRGAVIYIKNDPEYEVFSEEWGGTSKQAYYALSGSDAWQLKYNDPGIKVFYEDLDEKPLGVIEFTARLN